MIPRTYEILRRAVEEGAAYGVNRAHKYEDAPARDTIAAAVTEAVMGSIAEVFEFPEPPTPASILTREEAEYIYAALAAKLSSSAPSAEGPHAPAAPASPGKAGSGRAPEREHTPAYMAGFIAEPTDECPFATGTDERQDWLRGRSEAG